MCMTSGPLKASVAERTVSSSSIPIDNIRTWSHMRPNIVPATKSNPTSVSMPIRKYTKSAGNIQSFWVLRHLKMMGLKDGDLKLTRLRTR